MACRQTLSFAVPVITSIVNGTNMVTNGGTLVTLRGVSFGPVGTPLVVTYGPLRADASGAMQATSRYTAVGCSVTVADVEIQCWRCEACGGGGGGIGCAWS